MGLENSSKLPCTLTISWIWKWRLWQRRKFQKYWMLMPHFLVRKMREQQSLSVLLLPPKLTTCASSTPWPYFLSSWVSWLSQRLLRSSLPFQRAVFLWCKAIHWTVRKPFWAPKLSVLQRSPQICNSDKENIAEALSHSKWDEITSTETTGTSQQSHPCQWGMLCASCCMFLVRQLEWDDQSSWSTGGSGHLWLSQVPFGSPIFLFSRLKSTIPPGHSSMLRIWAQHRFRKWTFLILLYISSPPVRETSLKAVLHTRSVTWQ